MGSKSVYRSYQADVHGLKRGRLSGGDEEAKALRGIEASIRRAEDETIGEDGKEDSHNVGVREAGDKLQSKCREREREEELRNGRVGHSKKRRIAHIKEKN